jgi:hypothetical protein
MAKPAVVLIGADKGGVGKTTVARTLLDYFSAHQVCARAFDTEVPRGTLKRFRPAVTDIVDISLVPDQMKTFDTLNAADASVTLIDIRSGLMSPTLRALRDVGFIDAAKKGELTFTVFHILGPSIASLDEIAETAAYLGDAKYFMVKNFINNTHFFEWDEAIHRSYSRSKSRFRNSVKWRWSRLNLPQCRSYPLSPIRRRTVTRQPICSCSGDMSVIGWAMFGPNTIASAS